MQPLRSIRPASAHRLVALGVAGIAGTLVYPYAVAVVQMLQHGYDGSSQAVSQLVHGDHGILVAVGAVLLGAGSIAIASALRIAGPQGEAARAGRLFLRAWGVCAIVWGAFPVDRDGGSTTFVGSVHAVAGGIGFACLALALLTASRGLRHDPYWRPLRLPALALTAVAVAALVSMYLVPDAAYGAMQRTFLAAADIWLLAVAFRAASLASEEGVASITQGRVERRLAA